MKKAMISQPMKGRTEDEIKDTREKAIAELKMKGYEVVNTLFPEWYSDKDNMAACGVKSVPLCMFAKVLGTMSLCDGVYFCDGWVEARGCRIEHAAAVRYGIEVIKD